MKDFFSLGLDFGTNSVRAIILNLSTGDIISSAESYYPSGENGIIYSEENPLIARQNPRDYIVATEEVVSKCISPIKKYHDVINNLIGIGIDTTASTPLPVDNNLTPLAFDKKFEKNINAYAWLWKDHSSITQAKKITELAKEISPQYLEICGGSYSSEWFFSKILNCLETDPDVFRAAYTWLELSDYVPTFMCGLTDPSSVKRNICAAGHKAMYDKRWNGLPSEHFLSRLSPELSSLRKRLYDIAYPAGEIFGYLSEYFKQKFELPEKIPVSVGIIDAHAGAVGAGVREGTLVKTIGTSTCDITIIPPSEVYPYIPGIAGIVRDSVIPGFIGLEAGQSAVGDIFNWFVTRVLKKDISYLSHLTQEASRLKAGSTGLIALDWNNGNRNIIGDQELSGLLLGQTLQTTDFEIYRALIEATAFGARTILERLKESGINIKKIIACGGIPEKNELLLKIYANVLNIPIEVSNNSQTVAIGAAIFGGYAALKNLPEFRTIEMIQERVCKTKDRKYYPNPIETKIYERLYLLYRTLHDYFGMKGKNPDVYSIMKSLIEIKRLADKS